MIQASVIIPIYNGAADLPALLVCLQKQTFPPDRVEYLLVDNNSSDQTVAILKQAVSEFAACGLTLRPLQATAIQSSYAARNVGIHAAQGQFLVFTDVDCRPEPQWLKRLVQGFRDESVAIVVGEIKALPGKNWLERYAEVQETLSQKHCLGHFFCPYGQTANLAIRRDALQQVGLFRPYLDTGGDADLCWRILQQTAGQFWFAEDAIVAHRHRRTLRELRKQWQRYGRSNQYLHVLHGIPLMRPLTRREMAYRFARWFWKELPAALFRGQWLQIIKTPLDLLTFQARTQGQKTAQFQPRMAEIEPYEGTPL